MKLTPPLVLDFSVEIRLSVAQRRQIQRAIRTLQQTAHCPLQSTLWQLAHSRRYNRKRGCLRQLEHELSAHAVEIKRGSPDPGPRLDQIQAASQVEQAVLHAHQANLWAACCGDDFANFCSALEACGTAMTGQQTVIRSREIATVADVNGRRWQYLAASAVQPNLQMLHQLCRKLVTLPAETAKRREVSIHQFTLAVRIFAMLLAIHPFTDGNGRVARALLHSLLQGVGILRGHYLPLRECFDLADYGQEIRLRHFDLTGDYVDLALFFGRVITAYSVMTRSALKQPRRASRHP
ncbi:Fic family protein [Parachitinimonas caeni]|uniref:Fic family protein n=1 Tax=Parachitinimonas caeni TaxID=3031301 RepID=A0ABT7E1V7_9NEIS|nr:Fic family protein [Parachitinimonas caeni]MDK2125318.1 Fic family protein [Parachitinimonas caeni]